jgi:hypothetical protein
MKIFIIYGQGGFATSWGMKTVLGAKLAGSGRTISYWNWNQTKPLVDAIDAVPESEKVAVIGYSLGANDVTWVACGYPGVTNGVRRPIDLAVGYDPTVNSRITPLDSIVKRAICFQQTGFLFTSMFFGRAVWTGPQVEVKQFALDHLLVPLNSALHNVTIEAVNALDH